MNNFYDKLNPAQKTAVEAIDGPLLVLAGPGTGKTQLLSIRAGFILAGRGAKIQPENILIVTYTNSAAKAVKERLVSIIGLAGYDVEVGTFHGFANSIIQESQEAANYVGEKLMMDDVEQLKAMHYILDHADNMQAIRPFRAPYFYVNDIIRRISELKKDGIDPKGFKAYVDGISRRETRVEPAQIERMKALAAAYQMYEALKEGGDPDIFDERGRYDFDDMILFATEALKKERLLAEEYARRYKFIMVDEFQDTNEAQLELLFTLLDYDNPNLCCVGDDDQSIYRFQGASVGNFRILKERFPSIKIMTLKDNYRSTRQIIDFASGVIRTIPEAERTGEKPLIPAGDHKDKAIELKEFTTETEELLFIVEKIREIKDMIAGSRDMDPRVRAHPYNEIAVLVRKRSYILKVIDAFLQAGIPYATDGREDISGEKRVKQLLDALDLANTGSDNPRQKDLLLYKVLSADYFRIPIAEVIRFFNHANSARRSSSRDIPPTALELFLMYKARGGMARASSAVTRLLRDAQTTSVHSILLNFIEDAGLFKFIMERFDANDVLRVRDLRGITSFVNMVKSADIAAPGIRLGEFLGDLKLRKANNLPIQGELVTMTQDGVRIFTAHSSKGMEFHTVFIPFCLHNKNWPSRRLPDKIYMPPDLFKTRQAAKDEFMTKQLFLQDETRLFYVASTRARSNLIFTASPQENSVSSQFLKSLKEQTLKTALRAPDEETLLVGSISQSQMAQDEFVGAADILRDAVKDIVLNPTSLNNYLTCKRKFLYDNVLMLPGAKRQSLVFGNCSHKALEELYRLYKTTGSFPDFGFFKNAFTRELAFQGVDKAMESRCLGQLKTLEGWFNRAAQTPVRPLELEMKMIATVGGGIPFVGKLDKIEPEGAGREGLVKVVDYKTGKPDDHLTAVDKCGDLASEECDGYLRQLAAYKLLIERDKRFSKLYKVKLGELVFLEPVSKDMRKMGLKKGDFVNRAILLDDEMVKSLEKIIKDAWDGIQTLKFDKFAERDVKICASCDFDGMCWQ